MINKRTLWIAMQDDDTAAKLVQIASKHLKLALEYGRRNTSHERMEAIRIEVERVRMERERILNQFQNLETALSD